MNPAIRISSLAAGLIAAAPDPRKNRLHHDRQPDLNPSEPLRQFPL